MQIQETTPFELLKSTIYIVLKETNSPAFKRSEMCMYKHAERNMPLQISTE